MTASPEVLCSQVHAVHPLLCRDVQLFHFQLCSDGKTSAGEKMTANSETKKGIIEVHTTSVASKKHQVRIRHKERRTDEQTHRQAEADRQRLKTVMSNWNDTREGGRQTAMSREMDGMECRERNLSETCHNKVMSAKQGEREAKRYGHSAGCVLKCRNLKARLRGKMSGAPFKSIGVFIK